MKPMANPVSIPACSAISNATKYATYRQEVGRILRNTSVHLPWCHKAELLSSFSWRLKISGYPEGFRSKVIAEGIAGYFNTLRRRVKDNLPLNRPMDVIRSQSKKRTKSQSNWFNSRDSSYNSVLFVPATPHSALAKILQTHEAENNQGRMSRVKIIEKAGRSVKSLLAPNNPWSASKCGDKECFMCSTATGPLKLSCRVPGVLYTIVCVLCEESGGKSSVYYGESGKNCYERGKKHLEQFKAGNSSHCMTIHSRVHHQDIPRLVSHYRMVPIKAVRKPLDRQISEALFIANSDDDVLLNSGAEWGAGRVPRAAVARPV